MEDKMDEINILLDKANKSYDMACEYTDSARKSKQNYPIYLDAANKYKDAAELYINISQMLINKGNEYEKKCNEMIIFSEYYKFEKEKSITAYYYEDRQLDKCLEHYNKSNMHITEAINKLIDIERNDYWERELSVWKYFKDNNNDFYNYIMARKYWDNNEYIEALDYYNKSLDNQKNLVEKVEMLVKNNILDPCYLRITKGNAVATNANINAAMSQIVYSKKDSISDDIYIKLIKLFYKCYKFSELAYVKNPEWDDYEEGSNVYLNNIREILLENIPLWKSVYIEFEDNKEFLKIMKNIDLDVYKKIESEATLDNNFIWKFISFWPLLFIFIIGIIFILSKMLSFDKLVLIMLFTEITIIILGLFILRTTGFLSEDGFLNSLHTIFNKQFDIKDNQNN